MKTKKVIKYRPTKYGKENPFVAFIKGKRVGVGGAIQAKPNPPALPFFIAEATSEQYGELLNRGLSKWIEAYEEIDEISNSSESDT
jgi:hypothetical protein